MTKNIFLVLALLGAILPMTQFIPWILTEGLDLGLFIQSLFANGPSSGFTIDLLITSLAFWIYMLSESERLPMGQIIALIASNLLSGLSFALPFFLFLRLKKPA